MITTTTIDQISHEAAQCRPCLLPKIDPFSTGQRDTYFLCALKLYCLLARSFNVSKSSRFPQAKKDAQEAEALT